MNPTSETNAEALFGAASGVWRIDPAHTSVTFSVRHLMSKVRGHFGDVDGRIVVTRDRQHRFGDGHRRREGFHLRLRDVHLRNP